MKGKAQEEGDWGGLGTLWGEGAGGRQGKGVESGRERMRRRTGYFCGARTW